ncbi:unnamed protein product [Urochloa decumbens]|uniref:F-box domain-containing protein n=1 Tax=Urochloa decumbens TaxID=240449 RepID=A0ABC8XR91_9POAL
MAARVPSLTDDVIAGILSRLPPHSIGRARAVCRSWNAIASDPTTVVNRALAARPPTVAAIIKDAGGGSRWIPDSCRRPVDAVRVDRFRGAWCPGVQKKTRPSPRALDLGDMTISAESFRSWDGVLCARVTPRNQNLTGEYHMLWNPLTDACAVVSAPAAAGRIIGGYAHPVTGRFHLLHSSDVTVPGSRGLLVAPAAVRVLAVGDGGGGWREVPLPESKTRIAMRGQGDRSVSLHGNLHWLVKLGSGKRKAALLVFDTVREEFRLMAAPERAGLDPATARPRVLPGGKLCVLALSAQQPPLALEVWVLDDYSDTRSWRLRETVRMDGTGLSPRWIAAAAAVEVVEGVDEGEEMFIQSGSWMVVYSVRRKAWRHVSVGQNRGALLLHRESILPPKISFGNALRGFRSGRVAPAESRSFWDIWQGRLTSANIPLQWSAKSKPYSLGLSLQPCGFSPSQNTIESA